MATSFGRTADDNGIGDKIRVRGGPVLRLLGAHGEANNNIKFIHIQCFRNHIILTMDTILVEHLLWKFVIRRGRRAFSITKICDNNHSVFRERILREVGRLIDDPAIACWQKGCLRGLLGLLGVEDSIGNTNITCIAIVEFE